MPPSKKMDAKKYYFITNCFIGYFLKTEAADYFAEGLFIDNLCKIFSLF